MGWKIGDEGDRFENLVALHLLKAVRLWKAMGEGQPHLNYARDKDKREGLSGCGTKTSPIKRVNGWL